MRKAAESITTTERYINRELSWLQFNKRVLEEAASTLNPLLERLKFLAIFESNLDEFYMVRVSGLIEQYEGGILELSPDGLTPNEQLKLICDKVRPLRERASEILSLHIEPELKKEGVALVPYGELTEKESKELRRYFDEEVFPLCTPLMLSPAVSPPFISSRSLNLVVQAKDGSGEERLARVKIPPVLPRAVPIPGRKTQFVLIEELIKAHLGALFPGVKLVGAFLFRVIRDADIEIRELEAADLITSIEQTIRLRRFGDPVMLEVESTMPEKIRAFLRDMHKLDPEDELVTQGLVGFEALWELAAVDKPHLRFPAHVPYLDERLSTVESLFETIRSGDVFVHHPFDSFRSVEEFVASAAVDPHVIGIKQTLYRVGAESPIVESLLKAAENGKQVAVLVELKARFDESNNLGWARALERAGVHVTYGFAEMKTHCKLCLIVRKDSDGVRSYAHIGTGNYNPVTARLYTDLGLFTSRQEVTQDISELFNYLTGFSLQEKYRQLLVAPLNLREGVLARIDREIAAHKKKGDGRLIFKLNALVDPEIIDALYTASNAGVLIELVVRGVCCLRPGVKGMSENITVRSIVGRFLEHSRALYFRNGGESEILMGSADLMRRNLDRRIETLLPLHEQSLVDFVLKDVLEPYLQDNIKAWIMDSQGEYHRPEKTTPPFNAQEALMKKPASSVVLTFHPKKSGKLKVSPKKKSKIGR